MTEQEKTTASDYSFYGIHPAWSLGIVVVIGAIVIFQLM